MAADRGCIEEEFDLPSTLPLMPCGWGEGQLGLGFGFEPSVLIEGTWETLGVQFVFSAKREDWMQLVGVLETGEKPNSSAETVLWVPLIPVA